MHRLTKRERDISKEIIKGSTDKEIAKEFCLATTTVKANLRNIYRKLEIKNRTQLALIAQNGGVI